MSQSELFEVKVDKGYEEDYYNPDVTIEKEMNDAFNDYSKHEEKSNWENPVVEEDVSDGTISMLFGDNWNGEYIDVTPIISKSLEEIAWNMTLYSSLGEFLDTQLSSAVDSSMKATGIQQVFQAAENARMDYKNITSAISNFRSFNIGSIDNILTDTDNLLQQLEYAAGGVMKAEKMLEDAISFIQGGNIQGTDLGSLMDKNTSYINTLISQHNVNDLLASFPHAVADKFMGADFTQNLFEMPRQLFGKMQNVISILSSVRAPTSIVSTLETISTIRDAVAEMKSASDIISQGMRNISALKSNIESGNYIGVFLQAKDACKFVEKTSRFAAQYPYNQAYETEGGHIFETDNTPGKERLHIQHCTGTDVEIAPNGDMVSKIKSDCQFIVEKDFQNHVKGNQLMLVDDTSEVQSKSMILTATEDLNISSKKTTYTTDKMTLLTDDTVITAGKSVLVASNSEASYSSKGPLYITSDEQIIIDAPTIIIGTGRTNLISMNASTTNIKSGSVYVSDGLIKMNGFITLN